MSSVFPRNPYSPRSGFWRPGPLLLTSAAFAAGIACTVALSHVAPTKTTPNPWGPEAQQPAAPAQSVAAPATPRSEPVRVVGGERITPAPRAADRNTGAAVSRPVAAEPRSEQAAKPAPPVRLNDYEREALAKAAAAKANAELAGGPAGAPQPLATAPGIFAQDDSAEAKRAQEAAEKAEKMEKARKAKARKLARERQLARARAQEEARAYGYQPSAPVYAQDYAFRGGGFFRPGGIW